jgi:hypothetical protein
VTSFGCGIVCGFNFSIAFRNAEQFAGGHSLASLLSFVGGFQAGQILALAILVPTLEMVFQLVVSERIGTILLSALAAHSALHWMAARAGILNSTGWRWPYPALVSNGGCMEWWISAGAAPALVFVLSRRFHLGAWAERGRIKSRV